eukprot:g14926.t1 g14926   contig21:173539-174825(-)
MVRFAHPSTVAHFSTALEYGEAESYRNVEVKYVPGKQAVLTIYEGEGEEVEGWVEKEKIVLSELETKEEMHALMVDKGFELRSEEEIAERKAEKEKEEKELAEMRKRRQAASQEARRKKQKEQRVDDLKDKDEL